MAYQPKKYEEIRDALLTDYQNQMSGADVSEGSDIYVKACALASALWGLYQYQKWIERQVFPDSADPLELERHAAIRGIARNQAAKASGTITLSGTNGTVIAAGLLFQTAEGIRFENKTGGTITAGVLDVSAQAKDGGAAGNIAINTSLAAQNPPSGCNSTAAAKTAFTGGTDKETDPALLSRLLEIIRQPPAGGNKKDYEMWARDVDGVDKCFVYPLRLGLGSVCVVPLTKGAGAARIPGQALLDSVKAHIDSIRPVSVKIFQVIAPAAKSQAVTASIKVEPSYAFAQVKTWVEAAIVNYLNTMSPLEVLYKSKLEKVISSVQGVKDRSVTTPSDNVSPTDNGSNIEMITPGTITITEIL